MGSEMWRTIREALESNGKAVRLCLIIVAAGSVVAGLRYV